MANVIERKSSERKDRRPGRPVDEALQARRRDEILAAATRLFAERGFSNTDTQEIADELSVSKGTLFRYFPTKRELFLAAVDRAMREAGEFVRARREQYTDPLDQMRHGIRAYLEFFAERPAIVELLIQERAQFKDRKKPTYFEYQEANIPKWRETFRKLIAEGRVRDVPVERITDVLCDLTYGTMFTNYFTGGRRPLEAQVEDILDIAFNGILTDAERRRRSASDPATQRPSKAK
jgi:AcrR family transcriptional regulator